jgi:hypothetical protein
MPTLLLFIYALFNGNTGSQDYPPFQNASIPS